MGQVFVGAVRKSNGAVEVIDGVDLGVADGEFMVFVGPFRCRKLTTLRMIAGLESVTGGGIHDRWRPGPGFRGRWPSDPLEAGRHS